MKLKSTIMLPLLLVSTTYAVTVQEGRREIDASLYLDPNAQFGHVLTLGLDYGKYVRDNLQLLTGAEFRDTDRSSVYALSGIAEKGFDIDSSFYPFVRLGIGFTLVDTEFGNDTAAYLSFGGGTKYYFKKEVSMFAFYYLGLDLASEDVYAEEDDYSSTNFSFRAGLGYSF